MMFLMGVLFHPYGKLEHFQQCNGIRIVLDLFGLPLVLQLIPLYICLVSDCKYALILNISQNHIQTASLILFSPVMSVSR